jgi:hypothetical protein
MKALLPNGRGRFFGVTFLSAIAAGALIGVPAVASASPGDVVDSGASVSRFVTSEPAASTAGGATNAASCLAGVSPHLVRLTGSDGDPVHNPVLLVHGWLSTAMPESEAGPRPVTTSTGIANSPFSRPVEW